jgi:hypothetical protein
MEPFEVCVRRWAEDTWSFLQRLSMDPRAWWPDLSEDLP